MTLKKKLFAGGAVAAFFALFLASDPLAVKGAAFGPYVFFVLLTGPD